MIIDLLSSNAFRSMLHPQVAEPVTSGDQARNTICDQGHSATHSETETVTQRRMTSAMRLVLKVPLIVMALLPATHETAYHKSATNHDIPQRTDTLDMNYGLVPRLQLTRGMRRARQDHIAGQQRREC